MRPFWMFVQTPNTLFVLFSEHTKWHEYTVSHKPALSLGFLCVSTLLRFEPFCQKILKYLSKAPIHKPAAKSQSYLFHCLLFCSNSPFFQETQNSTSHSCNVAFLCRCRRREYVFESRFCPLVWFLWSCCARGKKAERNWGSH